MLGNYRVAAQLVASQVVLSSTELVSYKLCLTETEALVTSLEIPNASVLLLSIRSLG
jgi:hypothetical protein